MNRRAATLSPDLARRILAAYKAIAESLSEAELLRAIQSGYADRIFDEALSEAMLDRSFGPVRQEIRKETEGAVRYFARDLPKAGKIDGVLAVSFDVLSPKVIEGVRALDSRVIRTLKDDIRETVRAHIEDGLRDGKGPREVARGVRSIVGLAPNQAQSVANYRAELESGKRGLHRQLRNRRYDKVELTPERIERMVAAYEKRMTAFHAETVSRTATLDSLKLGQRLAWEDAASKNIVDRGLLMMRWVSVGDERVRPEHKAMNGEEVPFDGTFSNGDTTPGEGDFNCRCIARVYQRRP